MRNRSVGIRAWARMLGLDFDPGPVNAKAYAAKRADGKFILGIINKDATQALTVPLPTVSNLMEETVADALDATGVRQERATLVVGREVRVGPHSMLLVKDTADRWTR